MSLFQHKRTYLDWASGAPVSLAAQVAFHNALRVYGNPSSPHNEGVVAKRLLEEARTTIARLTEVKPAGVICTSGATEANNLAISGVVMKAKERIHNPHVLYLASAHASVIETLASLTAWGIEAEPLKVTEGRIDLAHLRSQLRPETVLVVLDAVCGETGTRFDTRGVKNVLSKEGSQALLHIDASQAPFALPMSLTHMSGDLMTLDAQKVGGIRGVGALCMRPHVKLRPVMHGGGQEGGLRPGTEPVALAYGFAAALREVEAQRDAFVLRATSMRKELVALLNDIPDLNLNQGKEGVPHILNLSLLGRDIDYTVMLLDKEGFAVSTKSACETDSVHGSRAVLALTGSEERASSTLRISWGPSTKKGDLRRFAKALIHTVRFQDGASV